VEVGEELGLDGGDRGADVAEVTGAVVEGVAEGAPAAAGLVAVDAEPIGRGEGGEGGGAEEGVLSSETGEPGATAVASGLGAAGGGVEPAGAGAHPLDLPGPAPVGFLGEG